MIPAVTGAGATARQRGVALVTALLVVSLATVAAVAMATRLHVDVRRTGNLLHGEQAYAYAVAAKAAGPDGRLSQADVRTLPLDLQADWALLNGGGTPAAGAAGGASPRPGTGMVGIAVNPPGQRQVEDST